jgi:hypothetical protein
LGQILEGLTVEMCGGGTTEVIFQRMYRVFRAQADWTFILPSELPAKELHHLPRKMPPRGTTP